MQLSGETPARRVLRSVPLARIFAHELMRGNKAEAFETAWSRMDLVVRMCEPLDEAAVEAAACETPALHVFRTADPHYGPAEFGVRDDKEAIVARAAPDTG